MDDYTLAQEKGTQTKIEMPPVEQEAPEVVAQEIVKEVQPEPVQQEQLKASAPQESFKQLREKALRAERERDELLRYVQQQQAKVAPQELDSDDLVISPDEIVEGKHLSKVNKSQKKLQEQLVQTQQQLEAMRTETALLSNFPNIKQVCSEENIQILRERDPELAALIDSSPNFYAKAATAYKFIKQLGIDQKETNSVDKIRIETNAKKPRPVASLSPQQGDSPLSRANAFAEGLTDELKSQLWKEMQTIRKNS